MASTAAAQDSSVLDVLAALRARGDHYTFLNAALHYLRSFPDDQNVALQACHSYLSVGLAGPARDLLTRLPVTLRSDPDVRGLEEQVSTLSSGRVAFSSLQSQFESNLAQVCARFPNLCRHEAALNEIPRNYELYRSRDGNLHVARRGDGDRAWIPDLCNARQVVENATLPHNPNELFCGPYVVVGDRFGMLFERVFDATQKMFLSFRPRIYVVESNPDAFGLTLFVSDAIEKFCDDRVALLIGPDCIEQLGAFFAEHPLRSAPEYLVRLTRQGEELGRQINLALRPHIAAMDEKAQTSKEAMEQHYDSLPDDHWKTRFVPDPKGSLRVLGITSRFTTYLQYSMRDWAAAFESRGHEFRMLIEENDHDRIPRARTLAMIEEFKPDLVVIIDHLRHEYGPVLPANLPFVCWIQDLLPNLANRQAGESIGPLDFYISTDTSLFVNEYGYPASGGLGWTMATDDRTYSDQRMSEEELAPYRCDLSYVSNHSTPPKKFHDDRRQWFAKDRAALALIDHLFDALTAEFANKPRTAFGAVYYLFTGIKEQTGLIPASPETDSAIFNSYLYPVAELMFRQGTLEWVADYCDRTDRKLCLYGNGWEAHARFGQYARGFAQNGPELRAIYQASTINLQIIGTGGVHQRMLDGLAAGGFFLIRYAPADMMHEPIKKYLAAYRKYEPASGAECGRDEMPELLDAVGDFSHLRGLNWGLDRTTVSSAEVARYEEQEAMGFRRLAGAVFPEYPDISFASAAEFGDLADRYLADPDRRRQIGSSMRAAVVERHSYGALVDDLLGFIHKRLVVQS